MKKIIATVGPSLLENIRLEEVHNEKNIYRINGAHGSIEDIEKYILEIKRQIPNAKILMDLPGNKVRTENFNYGYIDIKKGEEFSLGFHQFNYKEFFKHLKKGDEVWANDSIFHFVVKNMDIEVAKITFLSNSTGKLLNNKGVHVRGIHKDIPFLFKKDKQLIELANKYELDYIGLSFVRTADDIKEAKQYIKTSEVISKVETLSAVKNLNEILNEVEIILIDRGDLSTEIGLVKVASYQKTIIEKGLFHNKKIFLATQFLKSMENNPIPTIAESIDLYNTLKSGIYGIQLSEETAIGKYPKECLNIIEKMLKEIDLETIG
ncbi:MAG: pyruvate kinase [Candidatus Marinarcus sp.]|uniref:pyruvate kinase n=1 Tax=Candidatus Marinarcus sp. TaxID=3100987 RepID=UPI003B008003